MTILTVPEVATVLRVPVRRAYELARLRILPVIRLGRQIRVSTEALEAWIQAGGQALQAGHGETSPVPKKQGGRVD